MNPLAVLGGIGMVSGLAMTIGPLVESVNQTLWQAFPNRIPDISVLLPLYYRGFITREQLGELAAKNGVGAETLQQYLDAWLYYPTPQDLVTWQAREVFEPKAIERYGLDAELEEVNRDAFYRAGMSDEQITNYWRAHWKHTSFSDMVELLHRGHVTEEDVWEWFRLVEVPPFWRDKLIQVMYNVPTRVDVRRWWDMRTIGEERLREVYAQQGYHGEDLENYVTWTKVYTAFPDLMARWSNGWVSSEQVKAELTALGMPAERVEEFFQQKVKNPGEVQRLSNEKDLTKAMIIKGIKKEVISQEEGAILLQSIGYDEWEAEYIILIEVEAESSPETYLQFQSIIQKFRKARGEEYIEVLPNILGAEREVIKAKQTRDAAVAGGKPRAEIDRLNKAVADAEYRLIQLVRASKLG